MKQAIKEQCYLGIDIGKYQHQATLINNQGTIIGESIQFDNNLFDFDCLLQTIKKQLSKNTVVYAGMESTGHYYWHLKDYLIDNGIQVEVFNPIETQNKAKTMIRKVKNDKIDSLLIAEITKQKQINTKKSNYQMYDDKTKQKIRQLRELTRFCEKLKGQSKFYKQEISVLLERLCPEFFQCFNNIFLKTPMVTIKKYFIDKLQKDELIAEIVKTSRNRIKQDKAEEIISIINNSLGHHYRNKNNKLQLKMIFQSMELIEKQIKTIKEQIDIISTKSKHIKKDMEYLTSIKGISDYIASVVLSEIKNIDRFDKKKQLTAFAGLDPSIKQSGKYVRKQGNHISKRGSKYLRKQLYYAAKTAIIFDTELKEYYLKKKEQGKHYNVIMIAVARKILMRIYAVLKQKRLYKVKTL